MKMAKASEADLDMAMDLSSVIDAITARWGAFMPEKIERLEGDSENEPFDPDDADQCKRIVAHLIELSNRGSIMRVVFGMAVLLDPRNRLVDPDADTLEHHPDTNASSRARPLGEWHEDTGPALWWSFPINEAPWCGQPTDDDWPHYHTHWTPLVVPVTTTTPRG